MELLRVDDPDDPTSSRTLAVASLRKRLNGLEQGEWPPRDWERYEMETALQQAETGNYNFACALLEMDDNPLRPLVEAGTIRFKRPPTTIAAYRKRIEAIALGKRS